MDFHARNVLLCLRYGIGDVVMETPVLDALRAALPEARITALGAEPATELLEDDPRVDRVERHGRWGLTHRWDDGTLDAARSLHAWLEEERFDLFLDVHHAPPLVGRVVWNRGVCSLEASEAAERAAVGWGDDGEAAIREAVRQGWGIPVPESGGLRLHLSGDDRAAAADFLAEHGAEEAPPAISPVASLGLKRWPTERFAELADRILAEHPGPLLLFCGPQEGAADEVTGTMRNGGRVVRVGALHLRLVAALLERCRAFVCNDTGLMHMAAAVGTPTVAVFGPTSPRVYRPGANAVAVGGTGFDCPHRRLHSLQPPACWSTGRCLIAERPCIERTSVDEVHATLRRLLQREASTAYSAINPPSTQRTEPVTKEASSLAR